MSDHWARSRLNMTRAYRTACHLGPNMRPNDSCRKQAITRFDPCSVGVMGMLRQLGAAYSWTSTVSA
jgi:hypothetical protein